MQLSGRELGSNTVYDLHLLDDGSMVAATEHGVAIVSMSGVKMLTNRSAVRNSYTNINRDEQNQLYVQNFRNQIYRITSDSLELVLDLTQDFESRVLGYRLIGETIMVYNRNQIGRYNLRTGLPQKTWNEKVNRQIRRLGKDNLIGESNGPDSILYFGNHFLYGDSIKQKFQIPVLASGGGRYYQYENEFFALYFDEGLLYRSSAGELIDCRPFFKGSKLQNLGHTNAHFWIGSNAGLLLFDPTFKDPTPKLLLEEYSVSCVEEGLQGNYWMSTLKNGIQIVPSVAITRTRLPHAEDQGFSALQVIPGKDSMVVATKNGKLFGVNSSGRLSQLIHVPGFELLDLAYKDSTLYAISNPYVSQLKSGLLKVDSVPGILKNMILLDSHVLAYSWYSSSLFHRSLPQKEAQSIPAFAKVRSEFRNNGWLVEVPFQKLWSRTNGSGMIGASMGRCKRLTAEGITYLDSIDGQPLRVVDIASDATNTGYVLSTTGAVFRINATSLELEQVMQFSCGDVPERLFVRDNLFVVYSGGEVLFMEKNDGTQNRFRDLIPFDFGALIDIGVTAEAVWLAFPSSIFRVPMSVLKEETKALVKPLQLIGRKEPDGGYLLPPDPGPIRISINYTDILARHELQYSYRLNEEEWIPMDRIADVLTLSNLAPGNYHLQMRVMRGKNIVNERSLNFTIAAHWYQTTLFMAILVVLVFSVTVLFFRWQIKGLKKRSLVTQKLNEAQLTALKSQMNPHFLFNVLNSMQTMVLKEDRMKANKIMSELSVFVRKILNYSDKSYIPVQAELEMIENYLRLEKHRFMKDFSYDLVIEENLESYLHFNIPPMLIQPFIENAINHGLLHKKHDRKLSVVFSYEEQHLICILEDNGIGRKRAAELQQQSKKHRSFASGATSRRIALLKEAGHSEANIEIEDLYHPNQQPAGTRVAIKLPLTTPE